MSAKTSVAKWEAVERLISELEADLNRPEGRWGMHGHPCVDDWYYTGLEYVMAKLVEIRDAA
jgi:hypothetical protein